MNTRTSFTSTSMAHVVGMLVLAGVFFGEPPALGQEGCPIPPGVTPAADPSVTAQQVENGAASLTCISHHPTVEAHDTTAMTSLRLLAMLNVLSSTPERAKRLAPFSSARLAPSPDGPLTHFASPRGEKCRLKDFALAVRERSRAEEASRRCGLLRMLLKGTGS